MALYIIRLSGLKKFQSTEIGKLRYCPVLNTQQSCCVSMKTVKYQPPPVESYEKKNLKLQRPMSPHVNIYKMEFHTILSISHRITGILLSAYCILFGLGSLLLGSRENGGYEPVVKSIKEQHLGCAVLCGIKFIFAFPFAYHFAAGIRHVLWDLTANFLKMSGIFSTGYAMIGLFAGFLSFLMMLGIPDDSGTKNVSILLEDDDIDVKEITEQITESEEEEDSETLETEISKPETTEVNRSEISERETAIPKNVSNLII